MRSAKHIVVLKTTQLRHSALSGELKGKDLKEFKDILGSGKAATQRETLYSSSYILYTVLFYKDEQSMKDDLPFYEFPFTQLVYMPQNKMIKLGYEDIKKLEKVMDRALPLFKIERRDSLKERQKTSDKL